MHIPHLKAALEALLFMHHKPLSLGRIRDFIDDTIEVTEFKKALLSLQEEYADGNRGIEIVEVANGYQFRTKVEHRDLLQKVFQVTPIKLSQQQMEVLSIVAFKQPLHRDEIDQIRGVDSSHHLRNLMDKKLVRMVGKSDAPGKPMLYGTTKEFLEMFGLRNLGDLPTLHEIEETLPKNEVGDPESLETRLEAELSSIVENANEVSYNDLELEEQQLDAELAEKEAKRLQEQAEARAAAIKEKQESLATGTGTASEHEADSDLIYDTKIQVEEKTDATEKFDRTESELQSQVNLNEDINISKESKESRYQEEETIDTNEDRAEAFKLDEVPPKLIDEDVSLLDEDELADIKSKIRNIQNPDSQLFDSNSMSKGLPKGSESEIPPNENADVFEYRPLDDSPHLEQTDFVGSSSVPEQIDINLATAKFDQEMHEEENAQQESQREIPQEDTRETFDSETGVSVDQSDAAFGSSSLRQGSGSEITEDDDETKR